MANIRVDVNYSIKDGSEIVFRSPVNCSAITGLIVYYPAVDGNTTSKEFALSDAHGNNVGDVDHLFAENVVVKVILDVTSGMAFVQNADTNAYLEGRFEKLLPKTELNTAITTALAQAKASGEFDGKDGEDGKNGVDGKSAYKHATENGYIGTETEFGIKLAKDIPTVTQDAGQSETLVMSQKAVTDLVNDALGTEETEYETVDSVEEMTDTSKSYVLSSTGTVWVYGVTKPQPMFTNLATSFETGRLSSSGGVSTSNAEGATTCLDYIPFATGDVVRVKGMTLGGFNVVVYAEDKSGISSSKPIFPSTETYYSTEMETTDVYKFTCAHNNVHLFRISGVLVGTTADVIITKNQEIAYTDGYGWYDTGMTPSASGGGGGGNYVDAIVKINENKTAIAELDKRVIALETDAETLTIPAFWQDAVDICISKIKALQVGRNCITFPFFSDNHQRNGYAGMLIAEVMKQCNIPYCFYGGDSISSGTIADEATMIAQDKAFDSIMSYIPNGRFCRAVGNHDGYWYDGTNKYYYNRDQIYDLFLREESIAQNKHFGEDGTYYYVDEIASKVRFVVLNTNGGSFDSTQLAWLQNTALNTENGWAVVLFSHQPLSNHYHALISNASEVISAIQASDADIVGCFSGHIHRDRIYTGIAVNTSDDSVGNTLPFKQVTITSDHTSIAYDDATKHAVANDDKSHAIDFVTINRATRTVNLTRLGIGSDRSYTY